MGYSMFNSVQKRLEQSCMHFDKRRTGLILTSLLLSEFHCGHPNFKSSTYFIPNINQYKTSVCVAHLMDSSLFLNVFIKDSNNASQRLALTIEHSASYATFVRFLCLICSYVTYA
ncbi:Serine/threonine-protein phosphatase 2A activator [Trichinella pseudospiralis]